jgi:tRNA(Leu) C34 or U34 (ribose-2'-O)-methylase TrmL
VTLTIYADGVANPANLARLDDVADLLGANCSSSPSGRLIAVENIPEAETIYGRRSLRGDATLAVGNERRGLSRRTLERADETVVIPTMSRAVNTLNVAAAAAVAGWFIVHGSGAQASVTKPEDRRPALLVIGEDHVEVGSTLRSAAAFGFRDVLLDDRGAGWFEGPNEIRREAFAAARRHKNAVRVHRGTVAMAERFDEIVLLQLWGEGTPIQRLRLTHGRRQLVIAGASTDDIAVMKGERVCLATLDLHPVERPPLRLGASILLAEISRQVGRRRRRPGVPSKRPPTYDAAISLVSSNEVLVVEPAQLLEY